MNIFTFIALITLAALLPAAAVGAIFWCALRDGERITRGEPAGGVVRRGCFIRGRLA